jgi:hypothetical protein
LATTNLASDLIMVLLHREGSLLSLFLKACRYYRLSPTFNHTLAPVTEPVPLANAVQM